MRNVHKIDLKVWEGPSKGPEGMLFREVDVEAEGGDEGGVI
jgi:hypothetical protein